MLQNLKLSSFTWVLSVIMILTVTVISVSAIFVENKIERIDKIWQLYQTDLSDKARLEGLLRAAIGFDGVIHDFKNYVLRHDERYLEQTDYHIGAARAVMEQYFAQNLSEMEVIALRDIEAVLADYDGALHKISEMIVQGHSISEIGGAVQVDDQPAIRALNVLRYEVVSKQKNQQQLTKSRIVTDLRAAMGFNGMIHKYKDYIIHHQNNHDVIKDAILLAEIRKKIQQATDSINQYRQYTLNEPEQLALNDIQLTLTNYSEKLEIIHLLMEQNKSAKEIDDVVKINVELAVRALHSLDREINQQLAERLGNVSHSIELIKEAIQLGKWSSILTIIFIVIVIIGLIRFAIIVPINKLTNHMMQLAENRLNTQISGSRQQNEIGEMARAVLVFKTNMIKRKEAEQALAKANEDLYMQLNDNKQLRETAEEQARKALLMSEHMVAANERSEKATAKAEKEGLFVSSILNAVRDAIITIDAKGIIETFNPGAEDMFGYKSYEMIGKNISMLIPEPVRSAHDDYLDQFSEGKSTRDQSKPMEQVALRKNGDTFPADITLNSIRIDNEIKVTGVVRDITERKKWEKQIQQLAMTDSLTGAANRNQYDLRLKEVLQHAQRFNMQFALMYIDLDKFKPVNDTYGHPVGDVLLKEVVKILSSSSREVDLVARLGGDEFVIIVNGIHERDEVAILAKRIIDQISVPFDIDNKEVQIGASIGISCYPCDSEDIEELKRMADDALYVSKKEGRNTYRYCVAE